MLPLGDSYVLCTDVIEYINQGLTNNKVKDLVKKILK